MQGFLDIPRHSASMDSVVGNQQLALGLLSGLSSVSSVVLNGRAPGDADGCFTCLSVSGAGDVTGLSVVDLACASTSLWGMVRQFSVLPFDPTTSKDHCALYLSLQGLPPRYYCLPRRGARVRVVRPTEDSGYTSLLQQQHASFRGLLDSWRSGQVAVDQALSQFKDALVRCASTSHFNGDIPWLIARCITP